MQTLETVNNETASAITALQEAPVTTVTAKHQNFLVNGDFDHTRNTALYTSDYSGAATVDADVSEEAWGWYAHANGVTALTEDTTDENVDADEATNTALKTSDHSRFATTCNNPRFNKVDGWAEIGDNNSLDAPLTDRFCKASKQYILSLAYRLFAGVSDGAITSGDATFTSATAQFTAGDVGKTVTVTGAGTAGADLTTTIASYTSATEVELATTASTTVSNAVTTFEVEWDNATAPRLQAGIYDNTPGQRKYLEGTDLELTGTVVGTPAGTTSREYFVVARTSWGRTIGTNTLTVSGAPNDASFSAACYVSLSWTAVTGAVAYDVYRNTGGTYKLLRVVYPQNSYLDTNYTEKTVGSYPTPDATKPTAFIETTEYNFTPTTEWQRSAINIPVPATYAQVNTTDKQWLRIGLSDAITGAGMQWGLQLDLISLDDGNGQFSRSPLDFLVKRGNAITSESGSQGTVGTGGGGGEVPPGDTDFCPVFETLLRVKINGVIRKMEAIDVFQVWEAGLSELFILNRRDEWVEIENMSIGSPRVCYTLHLENGKNLTASENQPIFSDITDTLGKSLKNLIKSDKIQTKDGVSAVSSLIRHTRKRSVVKISLKGVEKGFWMNDIAGHNRKYLDYLRS